MRTCSYRRFMKKWFCICFFAFLLILGNILLFSSRSKIETYLHKSLQDRDDRPHIPITTHSHLENDKKIPELLSPQPQDILKQVAQSKDNAKDQGLIEGVKGVEKFANSKRKENFQYRIAVLVIACNRPSNVKRCIDKILQFKPNEIDMPIIVSQDCGHMQTEMIIRSYENALKLVKQPDLGDVHDVPENMQHFMGYYKISRHFKFAINQAFREPGIDSVIIIEDDIEIAPDFFEYFMATRPLLEKDESIWCVSAWNDNGKEGYVEGNDLLYRSDFFSGLGWMINKKIWKELEPKWPKGFWDDWMRQPEQRKGRACIRPEISRTKTFGRIGVSQGQFYDQFLKFIKLNDEFYEFSKADLSYLMKSNYDKSFIHDVYSKPEVSSESALTGSFEDEAVRVTYSSVGEIEMLTGQFGLMTDLKSRVPRTAYKGVISFIRNGKRIYLAPKQGWNSYSDPNTNYAD